ncbi:unnamed protein product [Blepharisma stoltei]|uniref:CBM20 domain-containing protein n=1 Tax=Blepharisma stoltei TaxID=1481888 RepID=A0AAU9KET3_9CILI|nr:unnamed protein product [Blepharisma stoltei]
MESVNKPDQQKKSQNNSAQNKNKRKKNHKPQENSLDPKVTDIGKENESTISQPDLTGKNKYQYLSPEEAKVTNIGKGMKNIIKNSDQICFKLIVKPIENPKFIEENDLGEAYLVNFKIHYKTKFGERIGLVGNQEFLGNWNPMKAWQMEWNQGNVWNLTIPINKNKIDDIEYKYICRQQTSIRWEEGTNHKINTKLINSECKRAVCIENTWGNI